MGIPGDTHNDNLILDTILFYKITGETGIVFVIWYNVSMSEHNKKSLNLQSNDSRQAAHSLTGGGSLPGVLCL